MPFALPDPFPPSAAGAARTNARHRATLGLLCLVLWLGSVPAGATDAPIADTAATWPVIGEFGLVRVVVVPTEHIADQAAYEAQIQRLCPPRSTCFLNFHGNATGAALAWPMPDAIAQQPTAVFRRSSKQVAERLNWACRIRPAETGCF